jgi:hypothetical protein
MLSDEIMHMVRGNLYRPSHIPQKSYSNSHLSHHLRLAELVALDSVQE